MLTTGNSDDVSRILFRYSALMSLLIVAIKIRKSLHVMHILGQSSCQKKAWTQNSSPT